MKRYLYKNIVLRQSYGMWNAYYNDNKYGEYLMAIGFRTKADAYIAGKAEVDSLNKAFSDLMEV